MSLTLSFPRASLAGFIQSLIPRIPTLRELFPPILWAVPKKKTSHSKKRMRASNKYHVPNNSLKPCVLCGRAMPASNTICLVCYNSHRKELTLHRLKLKVQQMMGFTRIPKLPTSSDRLGGTGMSIRQEKPTPSSAIMPGQRQRNLDTWEKVLQFKKAYSDDILRRMKNQNSYDKKAESRGKGGRISRMFRSRKASVDASSQPSQVSTYEEDFVSMDASPIKKRTMSEQKIVDETRQMRKEKLEREQQSREQNKMGSRRQGNAATFSTTS